MQLQILAQSLGFSVEASNASLEFTGINTLAEATSQELSFLANPKYLNALESTRACAVFVREDMAHQCKTAIPLIVKDPYLAFAQTLALLHPYTYPTPQIHHTAHIDPSAQWGQACFIGPYAVLGAGVVLQDRVVIGAGCFVGEEVEIGEGTVLNPNITVYQGVKIGARCLVHSGAVIGADGFGFANDRGVWQKIPQIGSVRIGDDVEIGANCMIDRGALQDTVIESGVKIDNGVQVAHNVHIGEHTAIAGLTAIAGSTRIGKYCMIGGSSAIAGHLTLEDRVILAGASTVGQSLKSGEYGSAITVQEKRIWQRNMMRFIHLDEMAKRFKALERLGEQLGGYLKPPSDRKTSWFKKYLSAWLIR